jgi:hypothetical protein
MRAGVGVLLLGLRSMTSLRFARARQVDFQISTASIIIRCGRYWLLEVFAADSGRLARPATGVSWSSR